MNINMNILKNNNSSYGLITIIIHWLMALTLFSLFGLGLYMVELSYYDSWYKGSIDLHKSVGGLLILVLIFRIIWRLMNIKPNPANPKASGFEVKVVYLVHLSMYLLMVALMFSGYLISTADGREVDVFNLFSLPAMPYSIDNQEDISGDIHEILAWTLILLSTIHGLAALKHHFVDRDNTLKRMLKVIPRKKSV
jgi:cytochrome b561